MLSQKPRFPLWRRFVILLISTLTVYWFYFEVYGKALGGKMVILDDVRAKSIVNLRKDFDRGEVYAMRAYIWGRLEGRARIYETTEGGKTREFTAGPGKVSIRINQNWKDPKYTLIYEPEDVRSGHLSVRYLFNTKK